MGGFAWVTLATNDSYSLGALVLAHSLKKVNTGHKLVVLITPSVSQGMREQMQTVFDQVKLVEVLDSKDEAHLALLKRPELGITFTKIHCWRLTEYDKCVFLDADTLVVKNCDELFEREELSAAPDFSWPDCFNSGVFVFKPSVETFDKILQFAVEKGSFDGGDQGLLNQFFADWATEDIKKHLPFVYNLSSLAAYSYIPAFKQYGSETRIVHFIGTGKPWLQKLDPATKSITPTPGAEHLGPMLQKWWDLFCEKVHPNLNKNLEVPNGMPQRTPVEVCSNSVAVEINHEPPKSCLVEPYAPYRKKDDFRQFNLPYRPFDVKGSSGELLNVDFLLASVVPPSSEASWEEQQRQSETEGKMEKVESSESSETKQKDKQVEFQEKINDSNREVNEEGKRAEYENQIEKEEEKSPKGPYDYNSFFPDEKCVSNYLDHNVNVYQPFENHDNQNNHNHEHHDDDPSNEHVEDSRDSSSHNSINQNRSYRHDDDHPNEQNVEGSPFDSSSHNSRNENCSSQEPAENTPSLPRFLTISEDDKRQSGNTFQEEPRIYKEETSALQLDEVNRKKDFYKERREAPGPQKNLQTVAGKTELEKSKSMRPLDVTKIGATLKSELKSEPSACKFQPNVNTEIKKYTVPKLKPIIPKQNSLHKTVPTFFSKVTFYTEFLMSSEYREPADLPKDKIGFMETHLKETWTKRSNFEINAKEKFGPLPYATDVQKSTVPPKEKMFLRPLNNYAETYDLRFCKRQQGNKPKPKESEDRKENNFFPTKSAKGKKSELVKKRKSKEASENGNKKNGKRNSKKSKEKKVKPKVLAPSNGSEGEVAGTANSVEEILRRLWNFSKDYLHYFGELNRKHKSVLVEPAEKMKSDLPLVNGTPLICDEADRWNA